MWGRENDKTFREAGMDAKCPDPRTEINLKEYLTFYENDTITFNAQFKIPLIVTTDLTIFTIEDGDSSTKRQFLTFDAETRNLRWTRNATGGGPKRNIIKTGINDRWQNLTVTVSFSNPETPIVI